MPSIKKRAYSAKQAQLAKKKSKGKGKGKKKMAAYSRKKK
jgi:hypothetical protein